MAVGCAAPVLLHLYPELSPAPALPPPAPQGQVAPQLLSPREGPCLLGGFCQFSGSLLELTGSDTSVLP